MSKRPPKRPNSWRTFNFLGNDDETDEPDMDPGSWRSFLFVVALLLLGVGLMLALAYTQ